MNTLKNLRRAMRTYENPSKAKIMRRFFKTGKGEYGEGDIFLGIPVPQSRVIAKKYLALARKHVEALLNSKVHEERLIALLILTEQYLCTEQKGELIEFYLGKTNRINNWDLVDLSADKILGSYLYEHPARRKMLYSLARSNNIWERRIAIVSTFYFIKQGRYNETISVAKVLLKDEHDLIHKATGWMLREIGKRDERVLKDFLRTYYQQMPRTMLRYAIERFSSQERKDYLTGKI